QIGYFAECLLGGLHGVSVGDLLTEFDPLTPWAAELAARFGAAAVAEHQRFLEATALPDHRFRERFGPQDSALAPLLALAGRA
ncbi:MAG TPA: hypothetical protein VEJ86_02470, partial [Candidatus Binataceae bacterium]|nr:hypothetical protein [Candidatus Binataceae bacterium]